MSNAATHTNDLTKRADVGYYLSQYATIGALLLVFLIFSAVADRFLDTTNLLNVVRQVSTLAIVAFGMTIAMASGDFDLSVGSVAGLAGVIITGMLTNGYSLAIALVASLAVGVVFGLLNGVITTRVGIPSIIVTLGTSSVATGIIFMYTEGRAVYGGLPDAFTVLGRGNVIGLPTPIIIMLVIGVAVYILLNKTTTGRYIYAVGGNAVSAKLSGINTLKYRTLGLILSGSGAAIAGIVLAARLGSGQPTAGASFLLDGLAAVFLGMTTIKVGQPNVLGTVVGVLLIGIINNGLNLLGLPFYVQDIAKGIIMVGAVAFAARKNELKFF
ncbi:ABC transporter permease [Brevibacillus massiliensis]|uniref:ABC transporter permease n=1 Tax=Brevibacillus massiliensis TaxID=1118054 RepID=UPI0003092BA1|nr:ABC transporter permease [Brevibacillus massiliensis]